ncbi:hypothetical protein Agub_g9317 [Astrephomene gubernaculifera]|uniref:C2 NT-type domain-containing protein n=1 Tax=Astrephomene gubernaculifera TaxID=47775 RepID=A0AAD3HP83_9CHLO|nr:hypothetical protein Agub_g9317 [Astrephomene gubernaculifera]
MFGKILRAGKGSHGLKYRIDVQVTQLENLPTTIRKCRVVWARSAKIQVTEAKDVRGSVASFKQTLTQVSTMFKDKAGKLEPKEYEFKIQVPGKSSSDAPVTIGKATLDMAKYCSDETTTQNAMLPITFKVGGTTTGYLKMVITTVFLGDANEDGLTEVSGMTGLTSDHGSMREQDLDGFGDDEHARFNKKARSRRDDGASSSTGTSGRSSKADARSSQRKPLPPMAEEDDSDLEDEPEASPQPPKASRKKPAAQPAEDAAGDGDDNPFAKKVSKPPAARKPPPPKKWADVDDVSPLSSDISDSEAPRPTVRAKPKEPEVPLDDMKASLFATKKTNSAGRAAAAAAATAATAAAGPSSSKAAGAGSKSAAAGGKAGKAAAPPPAMADEDEDQLRNDLFSAKPKGGAAAAASSKPSRAPTPPAVEDEDEDQLRNDLFSAKPRGGAAAAATKSAASRSGTASAGGSAGTSSGGGARSGSRAPPPPQSDEEDDSDSGPSTSAAAPPARSKSRGRAAEAAEAAAATTGASALARAGSAKPPASRAGSSGEVEQLRQRVSQLEEQLEEEKAAKDDLNQKMQKYVDKIADLEDQLAEGNELYAQMKDMEAKYQAEMKDLMERHLAEVADLEEQHRGELAELRAELQEATSSGRVADVSSAEELKRLEAELAEQQALLKSRTAKLEADSAAAIAARQAAEAKLADANKMIDDSLLVATKHQQENTVLQEEVARLKRQLEDASMWDTSAAAAAVTATLNNGRRSSEDEEELEELREKVEELQEENARLQKLNEAAVQAAADLLLDIRALTQEFQGDDNCWSDTGLAAVDELALGVRCLCNAYILKTGQLQEMEARLNDMSQQLAASNGSDRSSDGARNSRSVKPHELLSRVQQLTAERDALTEKLESQRRAVAGAAAAQQLINELRQQVDELTVEKEAVERFKMSTIADLRRQNDELRSSLRSLSVTASPRQGMEDALVDGLPTTPAGVRASFAGAAAAHLAAGIAADSSSDGNWQELESLMAQFTADRTELRGQVEQLKADRSDLRGQLKQLRAEKAALEQQLQDLQAERAAEPVAATSMGGGRRRSGQHSGAHHQHHRTEENESDSAHLRAEVERLQAQLAELSEADAVIKEWSDYADGLLADKTRLEERLQELTQQLEAEAAAAAAASARIAAAERRTAELEGKAAEFERRAADAEREVGDAQRRAEVAESRVKAAEYRAEEAAAAAERLQEQLAALESSSGGLTAADAGGTTWGDELYYQPADSAEVLALRQEIARLEESLSGLRTQLRVSISREASAGGAVPSVCMALEPRVRHLHGDHEASRSVRSSLEGEWREGVARGSGSGSPVRESGSGAEAGPDPPARGWDAEMEQLRARNASLEAAVAGLQASLALASQQPELGSSGRRNGPSSMQRQVEDLKSQLADALQVKGELESTVVLLRSELERVPLVQHASSGGDAHDDPRRSSGSGADAIAKVSSSEALQLRQEAEALEAEVARLEEECSSLNATVGGLRSDVARLQEEKLDAQHNVRRLSVEMEELAEALESSNSENERLSLEVLNLRAQLESLEERQTGDGTASLRTHSVHSSASAPAASSHCSEAGGPAPTQQARSDLEAAESELAAARAAARELVSQLEADRAGDGGFGDEPAFGGVDEEQDLALALKALRAKVLELQQQSRLQHPQRSSDPAGAPGPAHAAAEQLAKATARIDELEQLLENAEIENQHLTEQLEECLTDGRKGADSAGSVAEECQSSYGGSVAAGATGGNNPYSYGHANTLALSAFEQRLAMAEGRRDELSAALDEALAANRRLEADVAELQRQLTSGRRRRNPLPLDDDDDEWPSGQVSTRGRAGRAASEPDENLKKRVEELQAANRKLESVCDDLEEKAQAAQERAEKLQTELQDAKERIRGLEAALASATAASAALQKRIEEEAAEAGKRQAKDKSAELELRVARLAREKAALEEQLAEERATRQELEETLKDKLDRAGDDEAAETVAAFEVKYNRLKERYKMLEESSQEEIDELTDQQTEAQSKAADLQRQVKQLQTQLSQNRNAGSNTAANAEELRNLRSENERLVQQLVSKTMELAELSESEITLKRELARLREVNMKLAQKATTLEAQAAMAQAALNSNSKPAKGAKK